ncbi:MAG: phosphoribosylanthranilate isomerase [Caldilineaceae bacterium]|nr:phosphoribosylanthranilate isomerase [Caldilineaceae bacterium]MDE0339309.1 phosphoribosylanthranilate isomerase [Caldilineaceae bacterium]
MTRVKICGITSFEDGLCAAEAGADFLGFIFFKKSPRYVAPEAAGEITSALAEHISQLTPRPASGTPFGQTPRYIGVFVNEPLAGVKETARVANLDFAQLHGEEPPAMLEALQGFGFKALRPTSAAEAEIEAEWYAELGPDNGPQLLIDAYDPDEYGGTGKKADWIAAAGIARTCSRLVLAGGLTPENVGAAVEAVRPWAVDVSSGVEMEPGRKDPDKVRAFVSCAKGHGWQAKALDSE